MSHMAAARQVYVCFLFVLLHEAKALNGALERLICSFIVMYRRLTLAKTDTEICS